MFGQPCSDKGLKEGGKKGVPPPPPPPPSFRHSSEFQLRLQTAWLETSPCLRHPQIQAPSASLWLADRLARREEERGPGLWLCHCQVSGREAVGLEGVHGR